MKANSEQAEILKQSVEAWNEWRQENPKIVPYLCDAKLSGTDLSEADLSKANLCGANLSGTDLREANLSEACLFGTNLIKASLSRANLSGADLGAANFFRAYLSKANLIEADLNRANLRGADLRGADLHRANLSGTNFSGADLSGAELRGAYHSELDPLSIDLKRADFSKANLSEVDLSEARLKGANFSGADLSGANLGGADVSEANFSGAKLDGAKLRFCTLVACDLLSASLTGVKLYGTSRDDWIIKDVKCDYVYWDYYGKIKTPKERLFEPGEFESLYKILPTIEYVFGDGITPMDPLIMDHVVEKIRQKIPEFDIKIDSISVRGLAPSIKFTVKHEEQKEKALAEVKAVYETEIKRLESQKDDLLELIKIALKEPRYKLLNAAPGSIVATDGSTINVQHTVYIYHIEELRKAIEKAPKKSFTKIAKDKALGIVQGALDDIAKDAVKDAAKKIAVLGTMLAPTIIEQIPHVFEIFKNLGK